MPTINGAASPCRCPLYHQATARFVGCDASAHDEVHAHRFMIHAGARFSRLSAHGAKLRSQGDRGARPTSSTLALTLRTQSHLYTLFCARLSEARMATRPHT